MSNYIIDVGEGYIRHGLERTLAIPVRINDHEDHWMDTRIPVTPYTEPDLDAIRTEAYEKGVQDTKQHWGDAPRTCAYKLGYENGLNDLWEAMQKAIKMYCEIDNEVFLRVFYDVKCDCGESVLQALFKNTPQHLIDSIRKYEQEKEEIKVGDEVTFRNDYGPDIVVVVTYIGQDGFIDCMDGRGSQYAHKNPKRCTKTGRHFPEIAAVLEKMREGQDG